MEVPINYWAVLGATIASMLIGFLWYGTLFGKKWMTLAGLTPESMKAMKMSPMGANIGMFIMSLLMAYVLAHGIVFGNAYLGMSGAAGGVMGAFWYWLGFAVPLTSGSYLWEGKSAKLWILNAGYYLVTLLVMGAILGHFA